jgi:hypothetical protein
MATVTEIAVVARPDGTFQVDVASRGSVTTHVVSVPDGYPAALGCANVPPEQLIRASFAFLLAHEPPSSILRRFSLDEIAGYFPDFPATISRRLHGSK